MNRRKPKVIQQRLSLRRLPAIVARSMRVSAMIMAIVAVSTGFGFLVAQEQLATHLASWLGENIQSKWMMLAALNLAFFLMAAVMDEIAIMVIFGPMLIAIANQFGVDPIHFGVVCTVATVIGLVTPPVGPGLYIAMVQADIRMGPLFKATVPFLLVVLLVLVLIAAVPEISTWLPNLMTRN